MCFVANVNLKVDEETSKGGIKLHVHEMGPALSKRLLEKQESS